MPLGQDIPDEFNGDNGLLLGDYFSNVLTAKGNEAFLVEAIHTLASIYRYVKNKFRTTKKSRRNLSSDSKRSYASKRD